MSIKLFQEKKMDILCGQKINKNIHMKRNYSISIWLLLLLLSCNKPKDFYNELGKGAYLTFVSSNNLLNGTDAAASVNIVVSSVGAEIASVNLYVAATATTDKTKWKLIKNVAFAGETNITATNAQIASALGLTAGNLPPGTVFNFYNEVVTKDGKTYSSINTSAIDLENQLAFNTALRWTGTVVCPYNAASIAGTYTVIRDDWQDWVPGDLVQVTAGAGANQVNLSQVWPNPAFAVVVTPLTINVDPTTGVVTVPDNVTFGDYGAFKGITRAGSSGFVFSCTGRITIRVHIDAPPFGDQGFSQLILEK